MADCALRNRIKQLAAKLQNAEETTETLTSAHVFPTVFEINPNQNVSTFLRQPYRSDLSKEANLTGIIESTLSFEAELKGTGSAGTEPNYSHFLIGCGFMSVKLVELTVSAASGTLALGELLTDSVGNTYYLFHLLRNATKVVAYRYSLNMPGTLGAPISIAGSGSGSYAATIDSINENYGWGFKPQSKTARIVPLGAITGTFLQGELVTGTGVSGIVLYVEGSNKNLWYIPLTGVIGNTVALTGQVSNATGTTTAASGCSQSSPPLTFYVNEDGVQRIFGGARGRVNFNFNAVGEPARMQFEFQGPGAVNPTDTPAFAEGTDSVIPPKFQGAAIQLGDPTSSPFLPVMAGMNVQVDNTLTSRQDATAASGLRSTLIVDRDFSGQMNPEAVSVGTYPFLARLFSDTLTRSYFQVGSSNGNIVELIGERMQFTNVQNGNRDEILINDVSFRFVRTIGDDEFQIVVR